MGGLCHHLRSRLSPQSIRLIGSRNKANLDQESLKIGFPALDWQAATDATDTLRFPAGPDAIESVASNECPVGWLGWGLYSSGLLPSSKKPD
jgi:hypothetical protein